MTNNTPGKNFWERQRQFLFRAGGRSNRAVRIAMHVVFWLLILNWLIFQTRWALNLTQAAPVYIAAGAKFLLLLGSFYIIGYLLIPYTLLRSRWLLFIAGIFLLYNLYVAANYTAFSFINAHYETSEVFKRMAANLQQHGRFGYFKSLDIFYFYFEDYTFSLFLPLAIKIMKDIYLARMEKIKLETDNARLELNFLKMQINPHFLFNTLNNLYSMVVDKDEVTSGVIIKLSDLMRYTLYESSTEKVPLEKEIKFISDYISLESLRHDEQTKIKTEVTGEMTGYEIAPMILITFIENAFKHGINASIRSNWVHILMRNDNGTLFFQVSNSRNEAAKKDEKAHGIGIINVRRRLQLIYPNEHELDIKTFPDTYQITLKLQLNGKTTDLHHR
jgi:two-component system, LytTR family, sensor kinase